MNIIWFRQDLRLKDNPALNYAARSDANVLPIYILDDENAKVGKWVLQEDGGFIEALSLWTKRSMEI